MALPQALTADDLAGEAWTGDDLPAELAWMHRARCGGADIAVFFPEQGNTPSEVVERLCGRCPVRVDCLDYALDHDVRYGTYGGLAPAARRSLDRTAA